MSGPLIASFSGKTVMLQVPDILKKTSNKISASTKSEDPWRLLFETTIESVVAASGCRLKPIDPSLLESLSEERLLASPVLTAGVTSAAATIDDPLSEPAVRAVIRQLQKDPEFQTYFSSCLSA